MIRWELTTKFKPGEWPTGVLEKMEPGLFNDGLFPLRDKVDTPFTVSPLPEAHVRANPSNSRHSTLNGARLSDATDFFIKSDKNTVVDVIESARSVDSIGGIGVYFDTQPSVMIHIDMRPHRVTWLRTGGDYITLQKDPGLFYAQLAKELEGL